MLEGIKKLLKHLRFLNTKARHSSIPPIKEHNIRMKDILLLNVSNTYDYGTMALAQNFIHYMRASLTQPVRFYIDALDIQHAIRLRNATAYPHIYTLPYGYKKRPKWFIYDLIFRIRRLMVEFRSMRQRTVAFLGYDGCERLTLRNIIYLKISTRIARVSLVNWSAIPYLGMKLRMVTKLFRNLPIFTRDEWSYHYLTNELGAKQVKPYSDMRLLELSEHQSHIMHASDILSRFDLVEGEYITLVPRAWDQCCDDRNKYIQLWSDIANHVLEHYPDIQLVLLPHVIWPPHASDLSIIHRIFLQMERKDQHRVSLINPIITSNESRIILGMSHFAISSRAAAALSAYQMNAPCIALVSDIINKDLILNDLALPELVIDTMDSAFYTTDAPSQTVIDTMDYIDSHYESLKETIETNVTRLAKSMYVHHTSITQILEQ